MLKKISVAVTALLTLATLLVSQPLLADDITDKSKTDIKPYCWFICPPDSTPDESVSE